MTAVLSKCYLTLLSIPILVLVRCVSVYFSATMERWQLTSPTLVYSSWTTSQPYSFFTYHLRRGFTFLVVYSQQGPNTGILEHKNTLVLYHFTLLRSIMGFHGKKQVFTRGQTNCSWHLRIQIQNSFINSFLLDSFLRWVSAVTLAIIELLHLAIVSAGKQGIKKEMMAQLGF